MAGYGPLRVHVAATAGARADVIDNGWCGRETFRRALADY